MSPGVEFSSALLSLPHLAIHRSSQAIHSLPSLSYQTPKRFSRGSAAAGNKCWCTAQTPLVIKRQRHKPGAPDREESAATHPLLTLTATKHYQKIITRHSFNNQPASTPTAFHSSSNHPQITPQPGNRPSDHIFHQPGTQISTAPLSQPIKQKHNGSIRPPTRRRNLRPPAAPHPILRVRRVRPAGGRVAGDTAAGALADWVSAACCGAGL